MKRIVVERDDERRSQYGSDQGIFTVSSASFIMKLPVSYAAFYIIKPLEWQTAAPQSVVPCTSFKSFKTDLPNLQY